MHIFLLSTNSSCCSIFKDQGLSRFPLLAESLIIIAHSFSFVKRFFKSFSNFFRSFSSNRSAPIWLCSSLLVSDFVSIAHSFSFVKRFFKSFWSFFNLFLQTTQHRFACALRFGFPSTACIVYHTFFPLSTPFSNFLCTRSLIFGLLFCIVCFIPSILASEVILCSQSSFEPYWSTLFWPLLCVSWVNGSWVNYKYPN